MCCPSSGMILSMKAENHAYGTCIPHSRQNNFCSLEPKKIFDDDNIIIINDDIINSSIVNLHRIVRRSCSFHRVVSMTCSLGHLPCFSLLLLLQLIIMRMWRTRVGGVICLRSLDAAHQYKKFIMQWGIEFFAVHFE